MAMRSTALVCAAALLCAVAANAQTSASPPAPQPAAVAPKCSSGEPGTLSVRGNGLVETPADVARLSIYVTAVSPTAEGARNAAAEQLALVNDAVTQVDGITPANITTSSLSVSPVRNYTLGGQGAITSYSFSNTVNVKMPATAVSAAVDRAVGAASNVSISGVSFYLSPALSYNKTVEARQQAAADAKATAKQYAEALGIMLGPLLSVADASPSSTPVQSTQQSSNVQRPASTAGENSTATPVSVGVSSITAAISAVFTVCDPTAA